METLHRLICFKGVSKIVEVRKSLLPMANKGVFALSTIEKNSFITLYPGIYYASPPLLQALDGTPPAQVSDLNSQRMQNSVYIMACEGGGFIDAGEEHSHHENAIGHIVNHSTKKNNVLTQTFYWHEVIAKHSNRPNVNRFCSEANWYIDDHGVVQKYFQDCAPLKGVALRATRDIALGEELLLDYSLSQKDRARLPWYYEQ